LVRDGARACRARLLRACLRAGRVRPLGGPSGGCAMPPLPLELAEGLSLPLYAYGGGGPEATPRMAAREGPEASSAAGLPAPLVSPLGAQMRVSVDWLLQLSQRTPSECLVDTVRSQLVGPMAVSDRGTELDSPRSCDSSRVQLTAQPHGSTTVGIDALISHVMGDAIVETEPLGDVLSDGALSAIESEDSGTGDEETISVFDASEADTPGLRPDVLGGSSPQPRASTPDRGAADLWSTVSSPHSRRGFGQQGDVESAVAVSILRRLSLLDVLGDDSLEGSAHLLLPAGADAEPAGQRLTDEEIQALPTVSFQSEEQQHCAVCLEAYQAGEVLTALHCRHFFHVACLAQWVRRATGCPLCRAPCAEPAPT